MKIPRWTVGLIIAFALMAGVIALLGFVHANSIIQTRCLPPFPDGHQPQEMLNRTTAVNTLWLAGMFEAAQKTARLNKKAALWTEVAVVLGGASSLFSSLASS
jgi:hypothetical protein